MIGALVGLFAQALTEVWLAKGDANKQHAALMTAEEKLARIRAKAKYGQK